MSAGSKFMCRKATISVQGEQSLKTLHSSATKRGKGPCVAPCHPVNLSSKNVQKLSLEGRTSLQPMQTAFSDLSCAQLSQSSSDEIAWEEPVGDRLRELSAASVDESNIYDRMLRSSPAFASGSFCLLPASQGFTTQPSLDINQSVILLEGLLGNSIDEYDVAISKPFHIMEPPTSQKSPEGSSFDDDYYANVGDAIRTLRRELPTLFYKELTYDIYREDVVFRDPRNTFYGLNNYKRIFSTLRFFGSVFYKKQSLWLDILRIWQPREGRIKVRWCIRGLPLLPWATEGTFDGTSEFKLDRSGKIYEHKVDNVVMSNDSYQPVLSLLNLTLSRNQTATPSFFSSPPVVKAKLCKALTASSTKVRTPTVGS